ncbi:MAG: zeta toxin family protein [Patescibacteria group bacterium]
MHDLALDQQQSFLLDGTLSSYNVAEKNILRSLKRSRTVQILYVYPEPEQA